MASAPTQSKLPLPLRPFAARPRLMAGATVGIFTFLLGAMWIPSPITRALIGWDLGVVVFLILTLQSMVDADHERMRKRAIEHDEGKHFILLLAIFAAVASVAAICAELATAKGQTGPMEILRVGLGAGTIALSWAFVQIIFAMHYAHEYYLASDGGAHREGLDFPGDEPPDYWDFVHFAVIIGATAQTADVTIVSKSLRRVSTVHSLISFAFNTAILALMINLAAGLF